MKGKEKNLISAREKLLELELDLAKANDLYQRERRGFCDYNGGSIRQENLRERRLEDCKDAVRAAENAVGAQKQLISQLEALTEA